MPREKQIVYVLADDLAKRIQTMSSGEIKALRELLLARLPAFIDQTVRDATHPPEGGANAHKTVKNV